MKIAEPYARATLADSYDAIVIGSGIGGLAAAALLARYGRKRVLVLERHYTLGGYTHVFHRPGYEWDVGVHYIGDVQPGTMLRRIFDDITDGCLEWADMGEVYDRVVLGDDEFAFPKGREKLRTALKRRFPNESAAIDSYFDLVARVVASTQHFFMEKALPAPLASLIGPFLRRRFLRFARRTTREVLESLTGDQRLIGVLTAQCGDYGLPPGESSFAIHALVANHYFEGGFYPVGGSGRIAETIVPLIAAAGGKALVNAEVAEVVIEKERAAGVRMKADGAVLRAPLVISDAGAANTFGRLLPEATRTRLGLSKKMQSVRPSMAHLCLYVGLKQTATEIGLPRANFWIYPDEHHDETFAALRRGDATTRPFTYISFPSAKDPDFARRHPGRATIDIITAVPYEPFAAWAEKPWKKRGVEYEATKDRLARQLLDVLYTHVPQAKGRVDTFELSTPVTTQHFCNYATGEIYGLDHTPQRFEQRWLRPRTGVRGLFLTGQDVSSCGVAGALMGGVLSASAILGKNLLASIAKSRPRPKSESGGVEPGSTADTMSSAA